MLDVRHLKARDSCVFTHSACRFTLRLHSPVHRGPTKGATRRLCQNRRGAAIRAKKPLAARRASVAGLGRRPGGAAGRRSFQGPLRPTPLERLPDLRGRGGGRRRAWAAGACSRRSLQVTVESLAGRDAAPSRSRPGQEAPAEANIAGYEPGNELVGRRRAQGCQWHVTRQCHSDP